MIINDEYKIEAVDDKNIALIRLGVAQKGKNAGEQTEKVIGYYSNISMALKALCKKEIYGTGIRDLELLNAKIELLYRHIDNVCKGDIIAIL